jgi:hypothetical protein
MVQVVIALLGADLIYFELNPNGQLLEVDKKENLTDCTCLAVAPVRAPLALMGCSTAPCCCSVVVVLSVPYTARCCHPSLRVVGNHRYP